MSTPVIESPTAGYLAAVEAALDDLPVAERAELLEDVRQHLAEVAAETGEDLEATLGSPATYAAELRSAAGLPPAATPLGGAADPAWGRTALWRTLREHPWTRATLSFLTGLRPAWWVLRGALVGASLVVPVHRTTIFVRPKASSVIELAVAVVFCALISVLLAQGLLRLARPWRALGVVCNIAVVCVAVLAGTHLQHRLSDYVRAAQNVRPETVFIPQNAPTAASLEGPSGLIYNIYPFDSAGQPLSGVQLFDQNNNPINVEVGQDPNGRPLTRQVPVSTDGHALDNIFPQTQLVAGGTPAPARSPVAAVPSAATAVVPPGPGSPQPVIVPNRAAPLPQATPVPTK